jgi:hypothetical protein
VTLRQAAAEVERAPRGTGFGLVRARLSDEDLRRLERRLHRLMDDFRAADVPGGKPSSLAAGIWLSEPPDA